MKQRKWRARYAHVPQDFPRRMRVLQAAWDMNSSEFGWRIGLNLKFVERYRQGESMPTLAHCSKIEHAAGVQTVNYLMGHGSAPKRPAKNDGLKGPGTYEMAQLAEIERRGRGVASVVLVRRNGVLGY